MKLLTNIYGLENLFLIFFFFIYKFSQSGGDDDYENSFITKCDVLITGEIYLLIEILFFYIILRVIKFNVNIFYAFPYIYVSIQIVIL